MIKVIENNNLNVLLTVIINENISKYPLGKNDFDIEGENLTKRIDINYFNKMICHAEYNDKELEQICEEYPYESLNFDITNKNYSFNKFKILQKDYNILKNDYNLLKSKYDTLNNNYKLLLEEKNKSSQENPDEIPGKKNIIINDNAVLLQKIKDLEERLKKYENSA